MRYLVLASDYDETLAHDGRLRDTTIAAMRRLCESGRKMVLVTGRELPELLEVCPDTSLFTYVVAENGALLYDPATQSEQPLGPAADRRLVEGLRERGATPLSAGRVIVATREPYEQATLEIIRDLGLELQVIFNKGAVMVLPSGMNKATGLRAALEALGVSPHNVVAVGDAENDHAFLQAAECGVAVANALPSLRERADLVTGASAGDGVVELIERLLDDDLASVEPRLTRHHIVLGKTDDGEELRIPPYGHNVLIAGTSGSGKSTLATGLLERFAEQGYQFCLVDPEGDYEAFVGAVVVGDASTTPVIDEVMQLLAQPHENVIVNLLAVPLADRPTVFEQLRSRVQELRTRTGHPHWLVLDEAHHLLPAEAGAVELKLPQADAGLVMITVHPNLVAPVALRLVDTAVIVGTEPGAMLGEVAEALGIERPADPAGGGALEPGEAVMWTHASGGGALRLRAQPPAGEHRRHQRKYAEGELPPDRSFYFRGPDGRLNLRAQNLVLFVQLAQGVDEETWTYHLGRNDYSRWFRDMIKDPALAAEAEAVEREGLAPSDSRARICEAINRHYTLPAGNGSGKYED